MQLSLVLCCLLQFCILVIRCNANEADKEALSLNSNLFQHLSSLIEKNRKAVESKSPTFENYDNNGDVVRLNATLGTVLGKKFPESYAFYDIPYAEPPIGDLRFMPPVPRKVTSNTLNATTQSQLACQQVIEECNEGVCENNLSEDCLLLDIHVPSVVDLNKNVTTNLPVLFWLYGGFFYAGTGTTPLYDGRWLSNATQAIVVSINYRVGPFGFLYYEKDNEKIMGNQGLQDQQLALRWVQDNIADFGGDKNSITIFGESAGAQAVMFHLLSKVSKPLFHRAIMESNPAFFRYLNREDAAAVTDSLIMLVNCTNSTDQLDCLRKTNATALADAQNGVIKNAAQRQDLYSTIEPYRPFLDGVNFTDQPLNLFQEGKWNTEKRVIIGSNAQELVYLLPIHPGNISHALFNTFNKVILGLDLGRSVNKQYETWADSINQSDYKNVLTAEMTDVVFTCPTRALARFISQTADESNSIYLYDNTYPMEGPGCEAVLEPKEVCGYSFHSSEVVFVFRTGPSFGMNFTANDTLIADTFSAYWGDFARSGNPSASNHFQKWPPYVASDSSQSWPNIRISAPSSTIEWNFRQTVCDFWDATGYYVNISQSPSISSTTLQSNNAENLETTTTDDACRNMSNVYIILLPFLMMMIDICCNNI